jgi:hypothetical protein
MQAHSVRSWLPYLAFFRGHRHERCKELFNVRPLAVWTLDQCCLMFLEGHVDHKLPVTGSTMVFIGWHNVSSWCVWPRLLSPCRTPSHAALGNGMLHHVTQILCKRSATAGGVLLAHLRQDEYPSLEPRKVGGDRVSVTHCPLLPTVSSFDGTLFFGVHNQGAWHRACPPGLIHAHERSSRAP